MYKHKHAHCFCDNCQICGEVKTELIERGEDIKFCVCRSCASQVILVMNTAEPCCCYICKSERDLRRTCFNGLCHNICCDCRDSMTWQIVEFLEKE